MDKRLLLLMGTHTYRAPDFLAAARKLGVQLTVGTDQPHVLHEAFPAGSLALDFHDVEAATGAIRDFAGDRPVDAVVSADDSATHLAARASAALGLPGNPEESTVSATHKRVFREIMQAAGLPTPWFREFSLADDPERLAREVAYPCVLKPLFLSASRGVIRADDDEGFVRAFRRIGRLLAHPDYRRQGGALASRVLVEGYLPGGEVTLEGLMEQGRFELLAFFDKPDSMEGPFFEETMFVTPSRHPRQVQERALDTVRRAAEALGLRTGPVHAEVRLSGGAAYPLEIAPRSIGGHCSRVLCFGAGMSLEELILRQALGLAPGSREREARAAGALMIPFPGRGTLKSVEGVEAARAVPHVDDVEISIPVGQPVVPPPEGDRYLGFVFAHADTPDAVEAALRAAHGRLRFAIDPEPAPGP